MKNTVLLRIVFFSAIVFVGQEGNAAYFPKPAKPTHYFYTPTAYLNSDFDLVISLHEFSYTLPHNFQPYMSIVDNVGRVCFGLKYGITHNLSVGGGLAWAFSTLFYGGHGIHREFEPRLGAFLSWGPVRESSFEMSLTPHLQIGNHFSIGADVGMMFTPSDFWSIIGEFGFSFDLTTADPYINTIWGTRIHPPVIPNWSFDLGVDIVEATPRRFLVSPYAVRPFIDVIFTMKTR